MLFYIGSAISVVLAIYCWSGIKKAYDKGGILSLRVSSAIWILDAVHLRLVSLASLCGVWQLRLNMTIALASYKSRTARYIGMPKKGV